MKRFLLFIAFFTTAGVATAQSAQTASVPQTMSPAEEARMAFASQATKLDAAIQRNVPQAVSEIMNNIMADMQTHMARSSRELATMTDAVSKGELSKRIAAQSDIYAAVKGL